MKHIALTFIGAACTLTAADTKTVLTGDPSTTSRKVSYHESDIVPLSVQTGFSTLIEIPKEETILEVSIGDKDNYGVNWTGNLAYLKPAKAGSRTNFNLITASGNVYSFIASEITGNAEAHADLKVFVSPADGTGIAALVDKPRFVSVDTVDGYKRAAEQAQRELSAERLAAQQAKATKAPEPKPIEPQAALPASIRHDFKYSLPSRNPFGVTAIFHDDKFTYIDARPREAPAIYELLDGKPSLLEFQLKDGRYTIPKLLDEGFMRVGKAELKFHREAL